MRCGATLGATVDTQKVKYAKTPGCHFGTELGPRAHDSGSAPLSSEGEPTPWLFLFATYAYRPRDHGALAEWVASRQKLSLKNAEIIRTHAGLALGAVLRFWV